MSNFEVIDAGNGKRVKVWNKGVPFDANTIEQLKATAQLPFIFQNVCAMPDAHLGTGSTVGSVIPTLGAVCPAAVGVDIGCGMFAQKLKTTRAFLESTGLPWVREQIEHAVPHGRTNNGRAGDRGAWFNVPDAIQKIWDEQFAEDYALIIKDDPSAAAMNTVSHLGTLGTGNHFIELAEDEEQSVWLVLHSGSRGLGNKIGTYFSRLAQEMCEKSFITLPNKDLAYIPVDRPEFKRYRFAVDFAQRFAWNNRIVMAHAIRNALDVRPSGFGSSLEEVHCHHNYISWEHHFGQNVMVTRKGAVRADKDMLGIIPGSMGAKTFIVRGLGSRDSFCSCSHGAGRKMSRTAAKKIFTLEQHTAATLGVECDKTLGTIDETPQAYKDIEAVMAAQSDLVEPVHTLKQFLCVKGLSDDARRKKGASK